MIGVDTNVLIYACDQANPRRQQIALDLVTNAKDGVLLVAGRLRIHFSPAQATAIVAREFALPAVVAAANATSSLVDGEEVTVDGSRGVVARS